MPTTARCSACSTPNSWSTRWRLLTTLPVAGAADAFGVADIYRRRWAIEQLFRTLKTEGFDVEGSKIAADAPCSRLVVSALVAADLPLLEAFTAKLQGKTARQKNPHPKGSLAYAAWVCARLGGWTGYYGKPGPIVMLNGWLRFQDAKKGASLVRKNV